MITLDTIGERFKLNTERMDRLYQYPYRDELLQAEKQGDVNLVRGHLIEAGVITTRNRLTV